MAYMPVLKRILKQFGGEAELRMAKQKAVSLYTSLGSYNVSRYSGTSLLRSPTGLGKSDLNGEVTLSQGVICAVEYNLGLSQGDSL